MRVGFACVVVAALVGGALGGLSISEAYLVSEVCEFAPAWKLNLCNLTCSTCLPEEPDFCASCDAAYEYTSKACHLTDLYNTFYYLAYIARPVIQDRELLNFRRSLTSNDLLSNDSVRVCSSGFVFQMLGLYKNTDVIELPLSYSETMQQFTIKFNLLLLFNSSTFTVTLTDGTSAAESLDFAGTEISASYGRSSSFIQPNYLHIPALSSSNVRTVIRKGSVTFSKYSKSPLLSFSCVSSAAGTYEHWGISDITILAEQCNICVTSAVQATIDDVGWLTLYVLVATVLFLALLFCCMKISSWRKERAKILILNTDEKDFLPGKAILRISHAITKKGNKEDGLPSTAFLARRTQRHIRTD